MQKSRLQALCDQRRWERPVYTVRQEGPCHDPRFIATVDVAGSSFQSAAPARTSRESQSLAAAVAIEHLESAAAAAAADDPPLPPQSDSALPFKSRLQMYAQKRSKGLPSYARTSVGLSHIPLHKATVTIDGQTFESPSYFKTIREAENAAAEVALLSLPREETHGDPRKHELNLYKNLLQELAARQGSALPVYSTSCTGDQIQIFRASVTVCGEVFEGETERTKKQAEMSAAKIAYDSLQERKKSVESHSISSSSRMPPRNSMQSAPHDPPVVLATSAPLKPSATADVEMKIMDGTPVVNHEEKPDVELIGGVNSTFPLGSSSVEKLSENFAGGTVKESLTENQVGTTKKTEGSMGSSKRSSSSDLDEEGLHSPGPPDTKRVLIFRTRPDNLVIPDGMTLLPCSDHEWTAIGSDQPIKEGCVSTLGPQA